MMLLKISWRNVWRSKLRSSVIMGAIALGMWGGIFTLSLMFGMVQQRFHDSTKTEISHIRIQDRDFAENPKVEHILPNGRQVLAAVRAEPNVEFAAGRAVVMGMASSAVAGTGVTISGVIPADERQLTDLFSKITAGDYLADGKKNQIVVGERLAHKLKVKLRSKIVLTFQNKEGVITVGAFRIGGMFKTVNSRFDESQVFVRADDLAGLLGTEGEIHEIALLAGEREAIDGLAASLQEKFPQLKVETWADIEPSLAMMNSMMNSTLYIFMGIILFAVLFGIVNTMLMAILERFRELGMLMAVGMSKPNVFFMIVFETIFLAITGGTIGLAAAGLTIGFYGQRGIDISIVGEGMASFGMSDRLYPFLSGEYYPILGVMIIFTAIMASIYPAVKALKLNPAAAISGK